MKKILLAVSILWLCASPLMAAQQTVLGGAGVLWGDEKTKINSNFTELYGKLTQALLSTSSPTFVDVTLTSDLNLKDWIYFTSDDDTHYVAVAAGNNTANYIIRWPTASSGGTNYLLNVDADGAGGWTDPATFQAADAQLDTWATVTPSANGQSLVAAANYAAMRTLLDVEAGTDFNAYDADIADLADGALTASKVSGSTVTTASKSANYTIGTDSEDEAYGGTIYVTSAATITAPAVTAGMNFTVVTIGAIAVSFDVNASDRMYLDGTALADGDKATNTSTTGDTITCQYQSADGWYCWSGSPDGDHWTDGN